MNKVNNELSCGNKIQLELANMLVSAGMRKLAVKFVNGLSAREFNAIYKAIRRTNEVAKPIFEARSLGVVGELRSVVRPLALLNRITSDDGADDDIETPPAIRD